MKNAGLFVILFRRKVFEKSTCFLLAGLSNHSRHYDYILGLHGSSAEYHLRNY